MLSGKDDGTYVDVTGGWHDASDYLQYLTTSANAVYQMLFAYKQTPNVWNDKYDAKVIWVPMEFRIFLMKQDGVLNG